MNDPGGTRVGEGNVRTWVIVSRVYFVIFGCFLVSFVRWSFLSIAGVRGAIWNTLVNFSYTCVSVYFRIFGGEGRRDK